MSLRPDAWRGEFRLTLLQNLELDFAPPAPLLSSDPLSVVKLVRGAFEADCPASKTPSSWLVSLRNLPEETWQWEEAAAVLFHDSSLAVSSAVPRPFVQIASVTPSGERLRSLRLSAALCMPRARDILPR